MLRTAISSLRLPGEGQPQVRGAASRRGGGKIDEVPEGPVVGGLRPPLAPELFFSGPHHHFVRGSPTDRQKSRRRRVCQANDSLKLGAQLRGGGAGRAGGLEDRKIHGRPAAPLAPGSEAHQAEAVSFFGPHHHFAGLETKSSENRRSKKNKPKKSVQKNRLQDRFYSQFRNSAGSSGRGLPAQLPLAPPAPAPPPEPPPSPPCSVLVEFCAC